jgi:hypothetical protein
MDDHAIWQTLVQTAVVGAGRTSLPPPLLEELSARGIDIYASEEEVLLAAAALIRQRIRAGQVLPQRLEAAAQTVFFENVVVNPSASRFLSAMLGGKYAAALPEWLELFSRSGLSLPPESLPGLLSRCVADPSLREMLAPHLGSRARWLIGQNPTWADLESPLPAEQQRRLDLFVKQEKLDAKKIAGLPQGELLEKLRAFADECVPQRKSRAGLDIPVEFPDWAYQGGLIKKRKDQDFTETFATLLSWLPPRHWEERWESNPEFIYNYVMDEAIGDAWRKSLVNAAILYMEPEWAAVILDSHATRHHALEFTAQEIAQLSSLLGREVFQGLIRRAFEEGGPHLHDLDNAAELMLHSRHPWDERVSREWLAEFQKLLILSGDSWDLLDYREMLRQAAYKVPPLEDAPWMGGWEHIPQKGYYFWKDEIDYFLRVLKFRIDMHKAFY